jgi:transglycosylase-like protein with SLT domain
VALWPASPATPAALAPRSAAGQVAAPFGAPAVTGSPVHSNQLTLARIHDGRLARRHGLRHGRIVGAGFIDKSVFLQQQHHQVEVLARKRAAQRRARLAAERRAAAAAAAAVAAQSAGQSSGGSPGTTAVPTGSPQEIAMAMLGSYGWSSSEFSCLDQLWTRESGWNPQAANPYSGAFGIPQALPGSKMASAGADWATNPATQIRWGLGYIRDSYGSPCGAWSHELATGAY